MPAPTIYEILIKFYLLLDVNKGKIKDKNGLEFKRCWGFLFVTRRKCWNHLTQTPVLSSDLCCAALSPEYNWAWVSGTLSRYFGILWAIGACLESINICKKNCCYKQKGKYLAIFSVCAESRMYVILAAPCGRNNVIINLRLNPICPVSCHRPAQHSYIQSWLIISS